MENPRVAKAYLVDTHCHIHDHDYRLSDANILALARKNNVRKIITIGTDPIDSTYACNYAALHPGVFWSFGFHPEVLRPEAPQKPKATNQSAQKNPQETPARSLKPSLALHQDLTQLLTQVESGPSHLVLKGVTPSARLREIIDALKAAAPILRAPQLVAIGEIGLDYHFGAENRKEQIRLLEIMLQFAEKLKLPVSFHVRDAFADFWPVFDNFHLVPSVLHSFSDSESTLTEALKRDLYFGVNGLSTFATIPHAPLERIVLETDSPFLTPKPFRGKINMPAYTKIVAAWAAAFYGLSASEVARITTKNAEKIFRLEE